MPGYDEILASLTPEQRARHERTDTLLEALGAAGWRFAGGGPALFGSNEGQIDVAFWLPEGIGLTSVTEATTTLTDPDTEKLAAGWAIIEATEFDPVVIEYDGPVDDVFAAAVSKLVELAAPGTSQAVRQA